MILHCPHCDARIDTGPTDLVPATCPQCAAAIDPAGALPVFAMPAIARRSRRGEWWVVGGLAVALLLVSFLADIPALAASARWRPLAETGCAVLRCTVPIWREPAALRLLERNVVPAPDKPGALRISAAFRNEARWPQAWPKLLVTLSNAEGRVVAARAFAPADYLGKPPEHATVAPGEGATFSIDVAQPAAPVVAFDFALH